MKISAHIIELSQTTVNERLPLVVTLTEPGTDTLFASVSELRLAKMTRTATVAAKLGVRFDNMPRALRTR